jgi:hypothetical protein
MSLLALIAASQNGLLIRAVGSVIGVDEPVARDALERLLATIAERLGARAADPAEHDILLDVIASGSFQRYLDDPRALFGRDAVRDGEVLLAYLYGSVEAARQRARAVGPPAGLDGEVFARLMTLAASLLLGAMARRLEELARDPLPAPGPAGALRELGQTVLRGFADGTMRTFRHASFRRRMVLRRLYLPRRRRTHAASIEELLGDLLDGDAPA